MMVLLADPQSKKEIAFNNSLTKCRNTVERTLGVLKSRFRVLERKSGGGIQYELETAVNIIMACCVLHNYCRLRNMDYVVDEDIKKRIADEARLRQFNDPELIRQNESEDQELVRGEQLRQNVIASFK